MVRASGGISNDSDRFCFCICMLDKNYVQEEYPNWMKCKNCENWYHSKCVPLSDEEYEEIVQNNSE